MIVNLYHFVYGIKRLESILDSGFIYKDERIVEPCVCLSRNKNYLLNRGIRIIFDYNKLKYNYKVKPFCVRGWNLVHNIRFQPNIDEMEERVYSNVDIMKTCVRIDIDANKYKNINFTHPLINHVYDFKLKQNKL